MNQKYVLDRLEDRYAILENEEGHMCQISIENIEGNFKEGDILVKEGQSFKRDEKLTQLRREEIKNMMNKMWE